MVGLFLTCQDETIMPNRLFFRSFSLTARRVKKFFYTIYMIPAHCMIFGNIHFYYQSRHITFQSRMTVAFSSTAWLSILAPWNFLHYGNSDQQACGFLPTPQRKLPSTISILGLCVLMVPVKWQHETILRSGQHVIWTVKCWYLLLSRI